MPPPPHNSHIHNKTRSLLLLLLVLLPNPTTDFGFVWLLFGWQVLFGLAWRNNACVFVIIVLCFFLSFFFCSPLLLSSSCSRSFSLFLSFCFQFFFVFCFFLLFDAWVTFLHPADTFTVTRNNSLRACKLTNNHKTTPTPHTARNHALTSPQPGAGELQPKPRMGKKPAFAHEEGDNRKRHIRHSPHVQRPRHIKLARKSRNPARSQHLSVLLITTAPCATARGNTAAPRPASRLPLRFCSFKSVVSRIGWWRKLLRSLQYHKM